MANIIFYFTGTGNSLQVARDIANIIGDTKVAAIARAVKENSFDLAAYERIGFVFPVYNASMPTMVSRFIKKLQLNHSRYIFGAAVFGRSRGMALSQLSQFITECGGTLSAGFGVWMPASYIVAYTALPGAVQRVILKREKKKIFVISAAIKEKKSQHVRHGIAQPRLMAEYISNAMAGFGNMALNFHITERCTGCGVCERICPANNIKMAGSHPNWSTVCEQCVACIQWCPARAIEYGDKTAKRTRYQNPEITLSDMIFNSENHFAQQMRVLDTRNFSEKILDIHK
jgi:ferredoxin/flavodoxin